MSLEMISSTSASSLKSSKMHPALPPSSSTTFFLPERALRSQPTCRGAPGKVQPLLVELLVESSDSDTVRLSPRLARGRWQAKPDNGKRGGERCGQPIAHTAGLPVKLRTLKRSSTVNRSAPSRVHGSTENDPSGRCGARDRISPMISAPIGVRDAGLTTKGHLSGCEAGKASALRLGSPLCQCSTLQLTHVTEHAASWSRTT